MDDLNQFHQSLSQALSSKADNLEHSSIVKLREYLQGFEAGVSSMYRLLIDKGMMQTDPYKNEQTITEIQVPSTDPFADSDAVYEISIRFSHYVSQWEYLVNVLHVSLSNLNLKKIRRLMDLLDWIKWSDFSPDSSVQTTRSIALIVEKFSQRTDPMAGKIMKSSAGHLRDLTSSIKSELKILTVYLRERYKQSVRDELVKPMNLDSERYNRNSSDILDNVKFEFSHKMQRVGWYKELVQELLEEDYGKNCAGMRIAALDRLKVAETKREKKTRKGPDDATILLGVIERLTRAVEPIRSSITKMNENSRTIQERKKSLSEKLSEIFSSLFHRRELSVIYEISIRDAVTRLTKKESLDYPRFISQTMKRTRSLQELKDSQSQAYRKVKEADAPQLEGYIEKLLRELKMIHRRLEGLDAYFKSNAVPEETRSTMKPSSLNLKNLKGSISETMKALKEYKVKKEEEEQLRKLGIED